MKQAVLGLALGYNKTILLPFVGSLKKSGYRGDAWIFISEGSHRLRRWLNSNGIKTLSLGPKSPYCEPFAKVAAQLPEEIPGMSPHLRRYFIYRLFLTSLGNDYDQILLTDTRDVAFQRDPFDFPKLGADVTFVNEDLSKTIGTCPGNSRWMRNAFGESVLQEFKDFPISCSGTVYGSPRGLKNYLDKHLKLAVENKIIEIGADQAVHNFIIHRSPVPGQAVLENEAGPVITLHWKPEDSLQIGPDGLVRNQNGQIPNILHQYDRHAALVWLVHRKYCGKAFYWTRRIKVALGNRISLIKQRLGLVSG